MKTTGIRYDLPLYTWLQTLAQEFCFLASPRELRDQLTVCRGEMDLAMKQVPIDYAEIAVCDRQLDSLIEELKTCIGEV